MAIQRVILTDSRKEDVFYEEAIKTLRTNMQFSGVILRLSFQVRMLRTRQSFWSRDVLAD